MLRTLKFTTIIRNFNCTITRDTYKENWLQFYRIGDTQNTFFHSIQNTLRPEALGCVRNNLRFKSKKNAVEPESDNESDEEDDLNKVEEEDADGSKLKVLKLKSLRIDHVLKQGFGLTRRKFETSIATGKFKINGGALRKRGTNVQIGDQIEYLDDSGKTVRTVSVHKFELNESETFYLVFLKLC